MKTYIIVCSVICCIVIYKAFKHTFDNPEPEITVAYHRDRGEHLNQNHHKDVEEFFVDNMQEYGYLFTKDNKWLVSKFGPVSNLSVALEGHDVL